MTRAVAMATDRVQCANCACVVPADYRLVFVERTACCSERCADKFARFEVVRLRGYLSMITQRARGLAVGLAQSALYSNMPAGR